MVKTAYNVRIVQEMEHVRVMEQEKGTENATVIKDIQEKIAKPVLMASMKRLKMKLNCCARNAMCHVPAAALDQERRIARAAQTDG